jgi:MFS family permease
VDLKTIGFATALALPWALKALWAPLVDRYTLPWVGRRKTWILPMQLGLTLTCGAAALIPPGEGQLPLLLGLIFGMNLFAATMDIAVDGLAVDLLERDELGLGNAAQVVGYKVGMITGGGLLVWASASVGWQGLFAAMTALLTGVLIATLLYPEPKGAATARAGVNPAPTTPETAPHESEAAPESVLSIVRKLWTALRIPGGVWLLVFVATYKLGESLIDQMWLPYLVDQGFTRDQLGLWAGFFGMGASLIGSLLGGVLAVRLSLWHALALAACARTVPQLAQWALAAGIVETTPGAVVTTICAEAVGGGALTTVMFAFMMARVDRSIGATHYTLLATVEVQGKGLVGLFSGILAEALGYATLFGLGVGLSVLFLPLLWTIRPPTEPPPATGTDSPGC